MPDLERVGASDAAVTMFHERGYAATSVEDVARAAGLLKGSLYHYIDTKQDLLWEIVESVHVDVQRFLDDALARTELPPLERVARYARAQVGHNARTMATIAVYHHEWQRLDGERLKEVRRRRKRHEQAIVGLIEEARERGDVSADVDAVIAARTAFAAIVWPYTWYRRGSVAPARLADAVSRFITSGLAG